MYITPIVVNRYKSTFDVYIGRGSKWGNPFPINEAIGDTREKVIEAYREYLYMCMDEGFLKIDDFLELSGKTLGCYCKPKACHGDIIIEVFCTIVEMLNETK